MIFLRLQINEILCEFMILPSKHIKYSESLLGLGGKLLSLLQKAMTIDELWVEFSKINNKKQFPAYHSFDNVVLALDYLFLIDAISIDREGRVYNATN